MYRHPNTLVFKVNNLEPKKRLACTMNIQNNYAILPYLVLQFISIYSYKRVRKMAVTTVVKGLTNSIHHLYAGNNYTLLNCMYYKMYLSSFRTESTVIVRNKLIKSCGIFYNALKNIFKVTINLTSE
jgi:hypothetical protein